MGRLLPTSLSDVQSRLRAAFTADRPPRQIALSFAVGLFMIALPNLGLSLVVLGAVGYRFAWADARAFSAAAVVLNPVVKGGVYVASLGLGILLLGPIPGGFSGALDVTVGVHVLARLLVGNLLLALAVGSLGYVVAIHGIRTALGHEWSD